VLLIYRISELMPVCAKPISGPRPVAEDAVVFELDSAVVPENNACNVVAALYQRVADNFSVDLR